MASRDRERVTVAFELAALERLVDPAAAFVQTKGWARSVGIVSDRPTHVITHHAREWGLDYGFTSGPRDLLESLVAIRTQPEHEADRYLLIGTDAVDERPVRERGWSYLSVEDAAVGGGWTLGTEPSASEPENDDRGWP